MHKGYKQILVGFFSWNKGKIFSHLYLGKIPGPYWQIRMETVVLLGFGDYGCFFISSSVILFCVPCCLPWTLKQGRKLLGRKAVLLYWMQSANSLPMEAPSAPSRGRPGPWCHLGLLTAQTQRSFQGVLRPLTSESLMVVGTDVNAVSWATAPKSSILVVGPRKPFS